MTPGSLDPATVRLNRKLHELVEAIDATEHANELMPVGDPRGRFRSDIHQIRQRVQQMQLELEIAAAGT